jgi:hypothetical protein
VKGRRVLLVEQPTQAPAAPVATVEKIDSESPEPAEVDWHLGRMTKSSPKLQKVKLSDLIRDPAINCRAGGVDPAVAQEYREALEAGESFPAIVTFRDKDGRLWVGDGFHRCSAAEQAGRATIDAEVREGDRRAALLHAAGANASHGARRTNEDKRRAVELVIADPEWAGRSQEWIAEICGVTRPLVKAVQEQHAAAAGSPKPAATKGKDGKIRRPPTPRATTPKHKRRSEFEKLVESVAAEAMQVAKRARKAIDQVPTAADLDTDAKDRVLLKLRTGREGLNDLSIALSKPRSNGEG